MVLLLSFLLGGLLLFVLKAVVVVCGVVCVGSGFNELGRLRSSLNGVVASHDFLWEGIIRKAIGF